MNKKGKTIKFIILLLISAELLLFNNIGTAIANNNISESTLLKLVNRERKKDNADPLILNQKLIQSANNKARHLLENDYFSHDFKDSKSFSEWIKETEYKYSFIGENLAVNFEDNKSIIKAWIESSSHKENLLNKDFTETGISVQTYKNKTIIVQIFGRPDNSPIPLQKTIGNHISEILILYTNKEETNNIENNSLA